MPETPTIERSTCIQGLPLIVQPRVPCRKGSTAINPKRQRKKAISNGSRLWPRVFTVRAWTESTAEAAIIQKAPRRLGGSAAHQVPWPIGGSGAPPSVIGGAALRWLGVRDAGRGDG